MQHEGPHFLATEGFHALLILARPQGQYTQYLGFPPGEQGAAMGTWQNSHVAGDRPDFVETAAVDAAVFFENQISAELFLNVSQNFVHFAFAIGVCFSEALNHVGLDLAEGCVAFHLFGNHNGLANAGGGRLGEFGNQVVVFWRWNEFTLGFAHGLAQLFLNLDQGLQRLVAEKDSFQHVGFRHHFGAAFHHDNTGFGAGHNQVDVRVEGFGQGGIGDQLPVNATDAYAGDGAGEVDVGNGQCGRGAHHGEHIWVIFVIHGKDRDNDLGFVAPLLGEQGPDGAVDEPGGKGLFFTGATDLAAEIVTRDTSGGINLFLALHRKGQKVGVAFFMGRNGGDQHDGVAILHQCGSIGLLGNFVC